MSDNDIKKNTEARRPLKRLLIKWILLVILAVIAFAALVIGLLTVLEYRPDDFEVLEVTGGQPAFLDENTSVRIMSWNIGYGALGDNADFFMDGGKSVYTADEEQVK